MSTTGVQSQLYSEICGVAELLDRVLIALRIGEVPSDDPDRQRLAMLLGRAADPRSTDLTAQVIASLAFGEPQLASAGFSGISRELSAGRVSLNTVAALEIVAEMLERKRAVTFMKLRGS